jgi:hypothetical protein
MKGLQISVFLSCCSKSGDPPQEDLAKSGYKTNREVENLGILFHANEPIAKYGNFKRRKLEICPNPLKILVIS